MPVRSDDEAARCKLACLVAFMLSQRMDVPGRIAAVMSNDPLLQQHAADELAARRRTKDIAQDLQANLAGPAPNPAPPIDHLTALQLALAECEARTAPVTGRTVSSVEDSFYIGYQRRRSLGTQLWCVAMLSFGFACAADFVHAWVNHRLAHPLSSANTLLYPIWTGVVIDHVVLPTELLLWGFLGASLYLLRRLYDFTERRTFDHRLTEMYWVRLLMGGVAGAMLALLLVPLPDSAARASDPLRVAEFGSHAVAIVGGFSVRAVYAMLERISGLIRDQFARPPHAKREDKGGAAQ